jgi:adenylate cyclase
MSKQLKLDQECPPTLWSLEPILDWMFREGRLISDQTLFVQELSHQSDLRDFTHLTETLSVDQVLELLNEYFEFVAAAANSRGGEILRFIGDAMLIVFPIDEKVTKKAACIAALESAKDAQQTLAALNHRRRRRSQPEIKFGVGLNVGEVVYGNGGAPDRPDFTVKGPAVNRNARLESLTKTIGESILISEDFAAQVDCPTRYFGEHNMKGISPPQKAFAPDESCL